MPNPRAERHEAGRERQGNTLPRRTALTVPDTGSLEAPPEDVAEQRRDLVDVPGDVPDPAVPELAGTAPPLESPEADVADQRTVVRVDDEDGSP